MAEQAVADRSPRHEQMFPQLSEADIARMRPFGTERHFARGTRIATVGEPSEGMFVILSGAVQVTQRDGMGHVVPIVRHGPGQFLAEVGMLSVWVQCLAIENLRLSLPEWNGDCRPELRSRPAEK